MKIKQTPEDFQVEELMDLPESPDGAFGVYRLEKRGIGTIEAVEALCRARKLSLKDVAYGGLKDRHARTVQLLTIRGKQLSEQNFAQFRLIPQGRTDQEANAAQSRGNRFEIILRDLSASECAAVTERAEIVRVQGVPNYFDDQRFGSFKEGAEPFGRLLIERRYEDALRAYMTNVGPGNGRKGKDILKRIKKHWGDWDALTKQLPRSWQRSTVNYLRSHPTNFAGALERIRSPLKSLQLYAYQSALWNQVLAEILLAAAGEGNVDTFPSRAGTMYFVDQLDAETLERLKVLDVPMPHARAEPEDDIRQAYETVMRREGIEPGELKVRKVRSAYLKKGERVALCSVADLEVDLPGADAHNEGRFALRLRMSLPRGSYATIVIKDLTRSFWRGTKKKGKATPRHTESDS